MGNANGENLPDPEKFANKHRASHIIAKVIQIDDFSRHTFIKT